MVRILVDRLLVHEGHYIEAWGLSSDDKPSGCVTGSKFAAVDTGEEFRFDEVSGLWLSQVSGRTSILGATVTLGAALAYDGTEKTKSVSSVVLGETTLTASTDYVVVNNKATLPGTYTLHIVGVGSYCGVLAEEFTIGKGSGSVTADPDALTLTEGGEAGTSSLTVVGDGALSAASSAEAVATVELEGEIVTVTPVAEGSATVTVTLADGELYQGGTDTISVTVSASEDDDSPGG